ncbi:hypothetical protein KL905_004103 [Ogataea polymorpha]|nr:hypothetical protein KL905_004103 [Ogataea polymorpha]
MPSFTRLFSGISNAVKQEPSHSLSTRLNDPYHTDIINKANPLAGLKLSIQIESPPLMLYGPPEHSSGAIFSGLVILDVFPDQIGQPQNEGIVSTQSIQSTISLSTAATNIRQNYAEVKEVVLSFIQIIDYGKPFVAGSTTIDSCGECRRKITELAHWDVLSRPTGFAKGSSHAFPFSHLVPGTLPATSVLSNSLTSIRYELVCKARFINKQGRPDHINIALPVMIRRSILRGQDRNSLRVFPPTEVTATAVIPNVAYPKSTFPVEIRMDNVCSPERRWRMRKLNWKLEEIIRVRANHCVNHQDKYATTVENTKRARRGKKAHKNCGGPGKPVYNYYFEHPPRRHTTEENEDPSDVTAQNTSPTASPDLVPVASTWSVQAGSEALAPQVSQQSTPQMAPSLSTATSNDLQPHHTTTDTPLYVEEIRVIKSGELKSGWKSDFSNKGRIEIVADISLMDLVSMGLNVSLTNLSAINSLNCESPIFSLEPQSGVNCACDIEDHETGIFVHHNLVLEVIVAEELMHATNVQPIRSTPSSAYLSTVTVAPVQAGTSSQNRPGATHHSTNAKHNDGGTGPDHVSGNRSDPLNHTTGIPTGVARVLRMQFRLVLTERSGLGVAWDDEVPPTYNTVGALSPPPYDDINSMPSQQSLVIPLDSSDQLDQLDQVVLPEPARLH